MNDRTNLVDRVTGHRRMFYLLETILAPIWVWMVFAETPTTQTLIGGSILVFALIGHSLWQLRSRSLRAAVACAE